MKNLPPHHLSRIEKVQKLQENFMLSFNPPLPCITLDCLNTATVGLARWSGEAWALIPQCKECTEQLARLYGLMPEEEGE